MRVSDMLFAVFIALIIALIILFVWMSQPLQIGIACINKAPYTITISYDTNVPCWAHSRYYSETTCGFDHYGLGMHHDVTIKPQLNDTRFNIEMIFVGLFGDIVVQEYCLERASPAHDIIAVRKIRGR